MEAVISLDYTQFKKKPRHVPNDSNVENSYGHRPDSTTLWKTVKLEELIKKFDFTDSYCIEHHIAMATKKADHIVEAAVDVLKLERPEKFPGDTWSKIQSARADRVGRFDGHGFIYK